MKMHADYSYLDKALSAARMRAFFENGLSGRPEFRAMPGELYIPRVFPRESDSFAIQYVMNLKQKNGDNQARLILWGHLIGPGRELPEYAAGHEAEVIIDSDLGLVIPLFPFDPALPSLQQLYDRQSLIKVLKGCGLVRTSEELPPLAVKHEVLAYRLERRCVLCCTLPVKGTTPDRRQIVIRAMRPKKFNQVSQSLSWLAQNGFGSEESGSPAIPKVLATDDTNGLLFVEHVNGRSLHDLIGDKDFSRACRAAAETLQKLHGLPTGDLPHCSASDELDNLRTRIVQIGHIFPDRRGEFDQAFNGLESDMPKVTAVPGSVCIHRDFYDKQVLWSPERTTLLDCDTLAAGDPALDYGNFLAHLVLRMLQEPDMADNVDQGRRAFEQSFEEADSALRARVRWWQKASLVRLAALYALRPRWHHLTGELLQRTGQIGGQGTKTELARNRYVRRII